MTTARDWFADEYEFRQLCGDAQSQAKGESSQDFVRMIGISGIGMKSPDMLAAHGCHACHSAVDGQTKTDYTYEQRRIMLLEGMARTQAWLIEQEIVT